MKTNYLCAAILCFLIAFITIVLWWLWADLQTWLNEPRAVEFRQPVSREQLKKSMRYHGINYAYQDEQGRWVFERGEKICQLF